MAVRRIGSSAEANLGRSVEIDTSAWTPVDIAALPEDRRVQFLNRKIAIELYSILMVQTTRPFKSPPD